MHVIFGILLTAVGFGVSYAVKESLLFDGLLNPAALILLALGPLGVTMVSHPFREWGRNLSVLARAFRHNKVKSLTRAADEMGRLARAVRESRWQDAEQVVATADSEQVRNLAPHLLARLEPDALHEAVASSSFGWMVEVKTADEFLQGLARVSPAFGMIGTIMGLVDLFKNMRDSASLGPGMAMALLATLYGLILCYVFYMPLAQRVRSYLTAGAHEQRVIERALNLVMDGRPVGEIRSAVLNSAHEGKAGTFSAAPEAGAPRS